MSTTPRVDYQTHPSQYKHWKLSFEGPVATLKADFHVDTSAQPLDETFQILRRTVREALQIPR